MKQLAIATLLVVFGCGGCGADSKETAAPKSSDEHPLQSQSDALQRAKDAAKSLEAAGRRTESEIEKNSKD